MIHFDAYVGHIDDCIRQAISVARSHEDTAWFDFNGVTVHVRGDSNPALIYRDWNRAMNRYVPSPVGPYPSANLTAAEEAHDAEVEAANAARRDESERVYREKEEAKRRVLHTELAAAPALALKDADAWEKNRAANTDPYGKGVVDYAEAWGRLMQARIANGAALADIADTASHDADVDGITGFMYGCAVGILARVWEHGEELRRWHNLKSQIRDEGERANESGGVLNPALLSIG